MGAPQRSDQPRPGKRERNKAENRESILAAARRVFADLGYEAASVRDMIGASPLAAALVLGGITALQTGAGKPAATRAFVSVLPRDRAAPKPASSAAAAKKRKSP